MVKKRVTTEANQSEVSLGRTQLMDELNIKTDALSGHGRDLYVDVVIRAFTSVIAIPICNIANLFVPHLRPFDSHVII